MRKPEPIPEPPPSTDEETDAATVEWYEAEEEVAIRRVNHLEYKVIPRNWIMGADMGAPQPGDDDYYDPTKDCNVWGEY